MKTETNIHELPLAEKNRELFVIGALDFVHRMLIICHRDFQNTMVEEKNITHTRDQHVLSILNMIAIIHNTINPIQDYLDTAMPDYLDLYSWMKKMYKIYLEIEAKKL